MAKNFVGDGARTRNLTFHDGKRQFWQRFPAFLGALVNWLLGTIILRPDLESGHLYMARFEIIFLDVAANSRKGRISMKPGYLLLFCNTI